MNKQAVSIAEELEELLPRLMKSLYPMDPGDLLTTLPIAQLRVMRALFSGPRSPGEVAACLRVSPSSVTQITNRMVETGLLVKTEDESDRRVKHLSLTEHAMSAMMRRKHIRTENIADALDRMDLPLQQAVLESLRKLYEASRSVQSNHVKMPTSGSTEESEWSAGEPA